MYKKINPDNYTRVYTAKVDGNIVKITQNGETIATNLRSKEEYTPSSYFVPFRHRNVIIPKASRFLKIMGNIIINAPSGVRVESVNGLKPSFYKGKVTKQLINN